MQKAILLFVINTEVSKQASKQQIIPHTTKRHQIFTKS